MTEKERQLADEEGGGGTKSYDGEKAWSSKNNSAKPSLPALYLEAGRVVSTLHVPEVSSYLNPRH
jgi:hypothetical protein